MAEIKPTSKKKQITLADKKNAAKLARMQALAQSLSLESVATTDGKARDEVRVLAVNPNLRVTISHLDVTDFSDLINRALDSGDYDHNPTARVLLTAIARKSSIDDNDKQVLARLATNDPRIQKALMTSPADGMSRSSTPIEITDAVTGVHISRNMSISGGTCGVEMFYVEGAELLSVGDKITVWLEDDTLFAGKITSIEHTDEHNMRLNAVDAMWYLKNNIGWVQPKRMKLSDAFKQICTSLGLPYVCKVDTQFLCPARVEAGATGMSLISAMIEETLYAIGKQYFVRMSPTYIELRDIEGEERDGKLVQEASKFDIVEAMTGFRTKESVEGTVANDIRFFTGAADSLKLQEVQDLPSIARYGLIRYHEVATNAIVTEQTLDNLLRVLKYPTRDLSVDVVGMVNLLPGDVVTIAGSVYVADSIEYNYTDSGYNMSIQMAQWQKPDGVAWEFAQKMRQNWESEQKVLAIPGVAADADIGDLKSAGHLVSRGQTFIADAQKLLDSGALDEVAASSIRDAIKIHQENLAALRKAMNSEKKKGLQAAIDRVNNDGFYSVYKKVGGKK